MAEQNHNPDNEEIEGNENPQITELVAYLDGELPEQEADRVERLLQANAPLRRDAECLDQTWKLLDSLESATASGEFTQKTLSSISAIVDSGESGIQNAGRWSLKKLLPGTVLAQLLIWCLAGFLACSSGLMLSQQARGKRLESTDEKILKELDLYLKYPKLWRIPDVQFLKDVSSFPESSLNGDYP